MLAVVGWPMAELINPWSLEETAGRAPSLFNGHLTDYAPFLIVFLGAFSALEYFTKDTVTDGDYNFDPLGLESGLSGDFFCGSSFRRDDWGAIRHGF